MRPAKGTSHGGCSHVRREITVRRGKAGSAHWAPKQCQPSPELRMVCCWPDRLFDDVGHRSGMALPLCPVLVICGFSVSVKTSSAFVHDCVVSPVTTSASPRRRYSSLVIAELLGLKGWRQTVGVPSIFICDDSIRHCVAICQLYNAFTCPSL